jgi:hypothetical protein
MDNFQNKCHNIFVVVHLFIKKTPDSLAPCRPISSVLYVRHSIEFSIQQSPFRLTDSRIQMVDEVRDCCFCAGEPSVSSVMYSTGDIY